MLLALVPGAAIGSKLAPILQPLALDVNQFAQTLVTGGTNWLHDGLVAIRDKGNSLGQNVARLSAELVSAVTDVALDIGASQTTVQNYLSTVLVPFVRDTANGYANAVTGFLQDVAGAFDLGRSLNFNDVNLVAQAYAAELSDPRLSSSVRTAIEDARDIVQRAGQTVVVQQGFGSNPFDTPGFVPGGASTSTVEEKLGQVFRLSLPFAAGTGGQRISLQLQGPQANQLSVSTSDGVQTLSANGIFELTIPEGDDQLYFSLLASNDVTADATVTLSATLVDATGQPTHTTQIESVVSVKEFVVSTDPYYETWAEDWSEINDSNADVAMRVAVN